MKSGIGIFVIAFAFMACNKSEQKKETSAFAEAAKQITSISPKDSCVKEITATKPIKAGETGVILPVGTKLCFTPDNYEIRVTLPKGYLFYPGALTAKPMPYFATYTCNCSVLNNHCQVFYADGMGFGCLQSSCSGSCTGKFTYGGYTVDKVVQVTDKATFFSDAEVQKQIAEICKDDKADYTKHDVAGVAFYSVKKEGVFKTKASCDCEGTQACKMSTVSIPFGPKIYFCNGSCNGCELTVN